MSNPTNPVTDISEFSLPTKMRELAGRILRDLFMPLREKITQLDSVFKKEQAASELQWKDVSDRLSAASSAAEKEYASQREAISLKEEERVSPIAKELLGYNGALETITCQREILLGQFKNCNLSVPAEIPAVVWKSSEHQDERSYLKSMTSAASQYELLQAAFKSPILTDFHRKKTILRLWRWGITFPLVISLYFAVLCLKTKTPPIVETVLALSALALAARFALRDLSKHEIHLKYFFFGVSGVVKEVQNAYDTFSPLAAFAETELLSLVPRLQQEIKEMRAEYAAQRERTHQVFYEKQLQNASDEKAAEVRHAELLKKIENENCASLDRLTEEYSSIASILHQELAALWEASAYSAADWSDPKWKQWGPDLSPEFAARIGTLAISADDLQARIPGVNFNFKLPALIPFAEGRCLLINATGAEKDLAGEALQSVAVRALAAVPPGKVRFTLIDPVGLGHNVADFMHLGDFNRDLINGKAWSEPQHIEHQLTKLSEDMETVIQTYLRKQFASIQEYNKEHKEVVEPFRFLVIFDFPVNFTEASARRLISIVKNGPPCGVYTLILTDWSKKLPYDFNIDELRQLSVVFERNEIDFSSMYSVAEKKSGVPGTGAFVWKDKDLNQFTLNMDSLPPQETSREIMRKSGEMSAEGMKRVVPFEKLFGATHKKDSWSACSTAENLQVPLGPAGLSRPQLLTLGGGQEAHALLVGRTGSGKTNLMHVIITNLALTYSPKELQLYLVDFKGGVGFKRYAEYKLPHAKVIAIESDLEFGMSVLQGLDAELKRRSELFRSVGVDSLAAYRAKAPNGEPMPRILLIVDEFQEFFTENNRGIQQANMVFDRLARQGRSFGLHFLLATQSLSGPAQLPSSIMGQIKVRIALPCSEGDSRMILAADNKAASSLSQPGEVIYNPMGGSVEGNNPFQVARFDEDIDLRKYLQMVADMAREHHITATPIVFEGNELARTEDCGPLKELFAASDWPAPAKSIDLFLGEPIAIHPPVSARLRRQSGSNLMILTKEESEGVGMCIAAVMSVIAQQREGVSKFYVADFTTADSEWAEHAEEIERCFSPYNISVLGRQRDISLMLATIAGEVVQRGENPPGAGSIFLVLQGMHRIKALRENATDEDGRNPVELLETILRDGPEVGVHVISWSDTLDNAARGLSRKAVGEFGLRAGSAMSTSDSTSFFDDLVASRISKPHRVIFSDEDKPGQFITFRPYSLPERSWLEQTAQRLRARIGLRTRIDNSPSI